MEGKTLLHTTNKTKTIVIDLSFIYKKECNNKNKLKSIDTLLAQHQNFDLFSRYLIDRLMTFLQNLASQQAHQQTDRAINLKDTLEVSNEMGQYPTDNILISFK